jgi:hypothetical protein
MDLSPATIESPVIEDTVGRVEVIIPAVELTGLKGRIAAAYQDGFRAIHRADVRFTPQTTLREDLKSIEPLPPEIRKQFVELITLAEAALYSTREPEESRAVRAEQLVKEIRLAVKN